MSKQDKLYMARAIELAKLGRFTTTPNPNVGCVIVNNSQVVGEGYHLKAGQAHAEVNALAMAGDKARGATAYVTLEPCNHHGRVGPCVEALLAAGIKRVVAAMQDPNPQVAGKGLARLEAAGVIVSSGLMQQQAELLNPGFLKRMRRGLPYVRLKLGCSLDGRTAMASGESKWITGVDARRDVQAGRAESSAILTTSATVLADDPSLTVRWHELPDEIQRQYPQSALRQPLRVVIDSQNRVTPQHNIIQQPGLTWLVKLNRDGQSFSEDNVQQLYLPANAQGQIDLVVLLQQLASKQINTLWIEAGSTLAGALIEQQLVDELIIYLAPKLLGDGAKGLCHLPQLQHLIDAPQFAFKEVKQIGDDLRLTLIAKSITD